MQQQIVKEMKVVKKIDAEYEARRRIDFIQRELITSGLKTLVLGVSGGQDSTLLGRLAQIAVKELGEEYSFIAVRLPYGMQFDEDDCVKAIEFIKPSKVITHNIKNSVDAIVEELQLSEMAVSDFNKGNIKARIRMTSQYAIAGEFNALVLGTDHSAENITGFFTKHGDGACDIAPLFGLNKRQGKEILKFLGADESLYLKVPTADLEDDKVGLSDEEALGVTYEEIDNYLEGHEIDSSSKDIIEKHYKRSTHKRVLPKTIYD